MNIVGYTFQAANYCAHCMIERGISAGFLSPGARGMNAEDALDQAGHYVGVDRYDEHSFDSGDFPKVILSVQVEDLETCETCGFALCLTLTYG